MNGPKSEKDLYNICLAELSIDVVSMAYISLLIIYTFYLSFCVSASLSYPFFTSSLISSSLPVLYVRNDS